MDALKIVYLHHPVKMNLVVLMGYVLRAKTVAFCVCAIEDMQVNELFF